MVLVVINQLVDVPLLEPPVRHGIGLDELDELFLKVSVGGVDSGRSALKEQNGRQILTRSVAGLTNGTHVCATLGVREELAADTWTLFHQRVRVFMYEPRVPCILTKLNDPGKLIFLLFILLLIRSARPTGDSS
jgi:hypothetical protein